MSARHTHIAVLLALLAPGCGAESGLKNSENYPGYSPTDNNGISQLRLDIHPAQILDGAGDLVALPQSVGPFDRVAADLPLGTIDLLGTGTVGGRITGAFTTPWASGSIPTLPGPVPATVRIARSGTVQNYLSHSDEEGDFLATVVPSEIPYRVSVVPDDPNIPFLSTEIAFSSPAELADFDLGSGVAIYGRVLTGTSEPLQGARVHARDALGVESSETRTDAGGWYVLRVAEDQEYTVVCTGRDHGRDPILTSDSVLALPELGEQVDFAYPDLAGSFKVGRVVDADGKAISGVRVQFTATALDGYDALNAALVVEDTSDGNGSFEASLVDGEYEVRLMPPVAADANLDHGGLIFATESNGAAPALGNIELPPLVELSGKVVDASENAVHDAQITCTEIGLGDRSWSTFAGSQGNYQLMLPPGPVDCLVKPPGNLASRLAWTSIAVDPSMSETLDLEVHDGTLVSGSVAFEGTPQAFSLVEVRDGLGRLLGSTLTASESEEGPAVGRFEIRVDLPELQ